jgi:hypothetical protein
MLLCDRIKTAALAALMALSGCGGGGGGGGTGPGSGGGDTGSIPPPVIAATMSFSVANAYTVPSQTLPASEAVLAASQFAVELAQRFQTQGAALSQTITCANHGQLIATLSDKDGNGIASAGDRISAQATSCDPGPFNDVVSGKLSVDLQAGTLLAGDKLNAQVQFDDGFGLARWQVKLGGSFAIAWERTTLNQAWRVSASARDDLNFLQPNGVAVYLRAPAMTKTVDYAAGRGQVSLAMRYEAGGDVALVSTPVPLSAYLNRIADQGTIEFQGANGKLQVSTSRGPNATMANILLIQNNASSSIGPGAQWDGFGHGFLWWDGQWRDERSLQPVFGTDDYIDHTFIQRLVIPDPVRSTAPDAVFRVQFSRPPATLPQLFYRFADITAGEPPALPSIGATAEVHGALLLVRPVQPLSHGRTYVIQASSDGVTWTGPGTLAPDIVLTDTGGHELKLYGGGLGNFQTPGSLLASIASDVPPQLASPGDVLHLSASARLDSGRSVTAYRWTQVSGTPLRFGTMDTAATTVQWGASRPRGVEAAIVQVQVTDSTGDTQVARIAIASADAPTLPAFMFLKREGGLVPGLPASTYFYTPPDDPYMAIVYEPNRLVFRTVLLTKTYGAYLVLLPPGGAPLTVGHVEQPGAIEMYNLYPMPCTTHAGYYDVREVAYAADGTFTRLAVDFKHVCDGGTPVYGSYRLNSTVPVAN